MREVFQRQEEGGRKGAGKMIRWAIKWDKNAVGEKEETALLISNG
jgi:hypothetical protein